MIDGIHDNLFWVDFVQHLIGEHLNKRTTYSTIDSRIHFGTLLDRADTLVHTLKKLVSQDLALQVVPSNCIIGVLLFLPS